MNGGFALSMDRDRFDTLQPEVLLPTQYADLCRNVQLRPPELRLRLAVLDDALRCYQHNLNGTRPRARRLFSETAQWFAAEQPEEPFSFVSICSVLGIDAAYLRGGLSRWQTTGATPRRGSRSAPVRAHRSASDRHGTRVAGPRVRQSA